jgi:hypothetical protein
MGNNCSWTFSTELITVAVEGPSPLFFYLPSLFSLGTARSGSRTSRHLRTKAPAGKREDWHDVLRCTCRLRVRLSQRKLLGYPTLRRSPRSPPTQLRNLNTALARLLRDSSVRGCEPVQLSPSSHHPWPCRHRRLEVGPLCKLGGHDVAEAQPALILIDSAPLAVHVVQQTADELRAGRVANEARCEVVLHPRPVDARCLRDEKTGASGGQAHCM